MSRATRAASASRTGRSSGWRSIVSARRPRTVSVGDTFETDVLGARAAGLQPLLVDCLGLAEAQADDACAVLTSLEDVLRWLPR